jgi:hypothetical protein
LVFKSLFFIFCSPQFAAAPAVPEQSQKWRRFAKRRYAAEGYLNFRSGGPGGAGRFHRETGRPAAHKP